MSLTPPRVVLVLSGGAARGLAHIGVLEALEQRDLTPSCLVGTSMGGLIAALSASGQTPNSIGRIARSFRFPRWFVPGSMLSWDSIFPTAAEVLHGLDFADLPIPLLLAAVDIERGSQTVLRSGSVLDAVRATCAIPGVLPPVRIAERWLIDGGVVNRLPVDVASLAEPDLVIAVRTRSSVARRMPELDWTVTSWLDRVGRVIPNPATAKGAFEILFRAVEIALEHTDRLAGAMAWPELLIDVDIGNIGMRDFHRLDEAVIAGRRAAEQKLPELDLLLARTASRARMGQAPLEVGIDPVCRMVANPALAGATSSYRGRTYNFCSTNCREAFDRDPARYLPG